jgi:NAD-dependent deacetylase
MDHILASEGLPGCTQCSGLVRPDVVLYEESLDEKIMDQAIQEISRADTLIVGGTSLIVYPAAGLVRYFRGTHLVLINMAPTHADRLATLVIAAPIGRTLAEFVDSPL